MVKVNREKCTGCGLCTEVCPVDAISIVDGKAEISEGCKECGKCIMECPNEALYIERANETFSIGPAPGQGTGFGLGRGRGFGAGGGGHCVCPNCGERVPHERGVPCYTVRCKECGSRMIRE